MNAYEQEIQRRNTLAFIEADKEDVLFSRKSAPLNAAGGRKPAWIPLEIPQSARLVPTGYQVSERVTIEGTTVTPTMILVCRWDADVANGYRFSVDDREYEVVFVHVNDYEKKAEVYLRG